MKKILIVAFAAALAAACSSSKTNVKTANGRTSAKNAKYQIIDQEFDNLLAPEADYDTLPAYELQACGDTYLPPAEVKLKNAVKPAVKQAAQNTAKTTSKKEVSNTTTEVINITNIYNIDETVPASSQTASSIDAADDLPDTL